MNVTKNRTKHLTYLINNWQAIQRNYSLRKQVGCSQEGINYHYFAKRLTTIPKGFCEPNLRVITQLITLFHNDYDFATIMTQEIKLQQQSELTKYISKKDTRNTYEIKQSELHIMRSGTHTGDTIRKLRH